MFRKILPDEVREELKRQRDIRRDLQRQIDDVYTEIGTLIDSKLSRWNISKLQQKLKPKATGVSAVGASNNEPVSHTPQGDDTRVSDAPPPPIPDIASLNANMGRMVNAAVSRDRDQDRGRGRNVQKSPAASRSESSDSKTGNRRIPNPRFDVCWCCGSKDHTRQKCPGFAKIKKATGWEIPRDYQGAYEKSLKSRDTSLKVVVTRSLESYEEFPETLPLWPMLSMPPQRSPAPLSNKFDTLADDEASDVESEVMHALEQITSNVHRAKDKTESQQDKRFKHPCNIAHLMAVAKEVMDGKIHLSEVDLETDAEYDHVWCHVDSGAGASVARKDRFPASTACDAPAISLTVANGVHMPNSGARRVITYNKDGTKVERIFYEVDVEMPILSVAELSEEGVEGSEVRFRKKGGDMEDTLTGRRCLFVKRKGVYFVKLYVPKGTASQKPLEPGFARPA